MVRETNRTGETSARIFRVAQELQIAPATAGQIALWCGYSTRTAAWALLSDLEAHGLVRRITGPPRNGSGRRTILWEIVK